MVVKTMIATNVLVLYFRTFCVKMSSKLSLHDGSPLGDSSPSHCACSDTNGLWHKAQHNRACSDNKTVYSISLNININISVLAHNVDLFNVIFNNVVNGLNVNIWGLS